MTKTIDTKSIYCVAIADCTDIIISHAADSIQSKSALLNLKTILKNIMPCLRDEPYAKELLTTTLAEIENLKKSTNDSKTSPAAEIINNYICNGVDYNFTITVPALCGAYAEHLADKEILNDCDSKMLKQLELLSNALGCENIISIKTQILFIYEILGVVPPKFIGNKKCDELVKELSHSYDFEHSILEDAVYGIFRKTRLLLLREYAADNLNTETSDFINREYASLDSNTFVDDPFYIQKQDRLKFVKGLQKYTLETLILTKEFLESQGLRFYLTEGTLLGAIRHNGFIPWDDDVDIAMPREDYDRLVKLAKEGKIPPALNFDALENNPKHWVLGAKMQLVRKTPYIQHKVTRLSKCNGPYVDIFPLDYWDKPAGIKAWSTGLKMRIARRLLFIKTGYSKATKKKIERIIARILLNFVKNSQIEKFAIKTLKNQYNGTRKYMVNLCSYYPYYKEIFPASFFGEPKYVKFEGVQMPVPCEYDYMLKTVYSRNYDTIPPVRVTNLRKHTFELDENFTQ